MNQVYKVVTREFGEFIGKFVNREDNGNLLFKVIDGGIDYRETYKMRPSLGRYYEYKPKLVEF